MVVYAAPVATVDLWSRISAVATVASGVAALVALLLVAIGLRSVRMEQKALQVNQELVLTEQKAVQVSLELLQMERARDDATSKQDLRRQAQLVSAWWGPIRPEVDLSDRADAGAVIFNGSMTPIYHANAVADHFRDRWTVKEVWSVVPPMARAKLDVSAIPEAVGEQVGGDVKPVRPGDVQIEMTFMDSAGGHWLRRRNGPLDSLDNRLVIWADSKRRERLGRAIRPDFEAMYQVQVELSDIAADFRFSENEPAELIAEFRAGNATLRAGWNQSARTPPDRRAGPVQPARQEWAAELTDAGHVAGQAGSQRASDLNTG